MRRRFRILSHTQEYSDIFHAFLSQRFVKALPKKETHSFSLQVPLGPEISSDAVTYLSHLVGHEASGSLLSVLKEKSMI